MPFSSVNPANGDVVGEYPSMSESALESALATGELVYRSWRSSDVEVRAGSLERVAGVLRERSDELAGLMTAEMGKPIVQARAEVEKCAWACEYYAGEAATLLSPETVETDARRSLVAFEPLGVVLAVMPWNFPFWQVFRFAAPTLAAGNAALLKHASNVQGCARAIESVFAHAGLPAGLFQNLPIDAEVVADVIADRRVAAVTLTGSTPAGKSVAAAAGANLKKSVLELGGSDAYVVLEDADLDLAAEQCATSRLVNSGQSCIAAKRFIAVRSVFDDFRDRFVARMDAAVMGDPTDEDTEVGPLAREDLRNELGDQVERSVARGARVLTGGAVPDGAGWYYPPTVLDRVEPGMPGFDEELFGPVAAVIEAEDEDDAIALANQSRYGLAAAVFTSDLERGERIARHRVEAGSCFVNTYSRSDPRLPFGGIKESGYGRELGEFGIREFVNVKTVWVA